MSPTIEEFFNCKWNKTSPGPIPVTTKFSISFSNLPFGGCNWDTEEYLFNKDLNYNYNCEKDITLIEELYNEDSFIEELDYSNEEITKQQEVIK